MDIQITPDVTLPDELLYVSPDLDDELLSMLERCRFEVRVDVAGPSQSIRVSPGLAERIGTWQTLQAVLGRGDRSIR